MAATVTWNTLSGYTWNQLALGTWDDPLPYPLVRARNQGAQTTDATSHVINLPAGVQSGDLLYVAFSIDTATTVTSTTSTGWAKLASDKQGTSTNQTGEVWWKRATGSDALTITSSSVEQSTHISIAIQNGDDPVAVTANGASAASYTPPAITPAAGLSNYLGIISGHTDSSAGTTQGFGTASGFSNSTTQQASTTTSAATNTQEQTYTGVSTITPGSVTLSLAEQWVAITTATRRLSTAGAPTYQVSVSLTATPTLTISGEVYRPPDVYFDLSNWKLTVPYDGPDGDVYADEITQPTLSTYVDPNYFYLNASNQMVMDAPVNGDTTSGSTGVRAELREMDGAVESSWDKTTASRQLTVSGFYDPTNITGGTAPKKVMIVGQIHETGGTPGIYLTVDYDASPSRLRVFKDGPGVGNLVTGFTPTDQLAFRIECTAGNVNIYGVIGNETQLPSIPQFTFPSSGFVEITGSYLKTGPYNKTDTGTGSTGDAKATITYLNLNQNLPVTWQATVSLTATPSLTVNGVRSTPGSVALTATPTLSVSTPQLTEVASVNLIASPTISVNAVRIVPATVSLTILPSLVIPGNLTEIATVSLFVSPTITLNGVRIAPANVTLTATPTLTITAQITAAASVSLTATPTLSINAVRTTLATVSLIITPTISVTAQLGLQASVSLIITPTATFTTGAVPITVNLVASPTLSVNGIRFAVATVSLTVTPSLTIDGIRTVPTTLNLSILPSLTISGQLTAIATLSLTTTPTLSIDAVRGTPATLSLIATPTLSVNATVTSLTGIALSLTASPTLTVNARLTVLANFSGIATPTLSIDGVRAAVSAVSLTITPTLSVNGIRQTIASVSLFATPTISVTVAAALTSVSLLITPTISVTPLYIAAPTVQLSILPVLTVGAFLTSRATVALTVVPIITVSFFGTVPATVALIVAPTLYVDAVRYVPAAISLTIIPDFQVNSVRISFPAIVLTILPTISILSLRTAVSSVYLLIIPTLYVKGYIEGAGPGWPIVFRVVSVDDGDEAVSSVQTQFKPKFALQSVRNESGNVATVSEPSIEFEVLNAH